MSCKYKHKGIEYNIIEELLVTLNPNQIKLADGTNTTFDSNINDIRFQKENDSYLLYRSGDLITKSEDAYNMMGNRGSGHFGTGFYFFGDKTTADKYDERPTNTIDMRMYNMLRPKNGEKGIILHEALKNINNLRYKNTVGGIVYEIINEFELDFYKYKDKLNFKELDIWLQKNLEVENYLLGGSNNIKPFKKNKELTNEIVQDLKNEFEKQVFKLERELDRKVDKLLNSLKENGVYVNDDKKQVIRKKIQNYQIEPNNIESKGEDTIGTKILKYLGFEGINVKGIFELDNSLYGSVIFDIKRQRNLLATEPQIILAEEQSTDAIIEGMIAKGEITRTCRM